jgi:predicted nucleic acid-binding Zn ribbon protein
MRTKKIPQTIGSVLETMLAQRGLLSVCRDHEALRKWPQFMGAKIASVSECDRVENGVLYVRVASAPWRQELSYLKPEIIKKINTQVNGASIHDIIFS